MKNVLKHIKIVNRHRFIVFKLCCKFGIPFRGLVHDLSKYMPIEFNESVKYYTDGKISPCENAIKENGFSVAWEHHKKINKHHFEYWFIHKKTEDIPIMPYKYALEMFCDRVAASKVYIGENYNDRCPYDYYMLRKKDYKMNDKIKDFLEKTFIKLYEIGLANLTKNDIKEIYNLCIK